MSDAYLLVTAGARQVALRLAQVEELVSPGAVFPVPSADVALRGVTSVRGKLVPLVHLGALLDGDRCPEEPGESAILAVAGGRALCLEVEAADTVLRDDVVRLPADAQLPGASALLRVGDVMIPLLDLDVLAERLDTVGDNDAQS